MPFGAILQMNMQTRWYSVMSPIPHLASKCKSNSMIGVWTYCFIYFPYEKYGYDMCWQRHVILQRRKLWIMITFSLWKCNIISLVSPWDPRSQQGPMWYSTRHSSWITVPSCLFCPKPVYEWSYHVSLHKPNFAVSVLGALLHGLTLIPMRISSHIF